jgi:hypothetical protein
LFIFKTSSTAQPVWKIVFVPASSQNLSSHYQLFDEAFVPDPKKGEEANISTVLDRFSLVFRKRAGSNLFN